MKPRLRKLGLIAHISTSVGWLGAVAAFLVLGVAGLASQDAEIVRGSYLSMDLIGRFVIVPLSLASLTTGLVQALGTEWGLFRLYWIIVKLFLTVFATIVLLVKVPLMRYAARLAVEPTIPSADLRMAGMQLLVHAAGGLLVLLAITMLSIFKPWGSTLYGRRKQQERHESSSLMGLSPDSAARPELSQSLEKTLGVTPPMLQNHASETTAGGLSWRLKVFLAVIGAIIVGFVVLHLANGGLGLHGH